jgi:hypothetical protein
VTVAAHDARVTGVDVTAVRPRFRLRGRSHKVALTAHILTSVGWFGVALVVAVLGLVGSITNDPVLRRAVYRTVELFPWLSIPIGLAAIATGVWLGLGTAHGVFRRWWVVVKLGISAAVVVTDALVVARFAHQAAVTGLAARPLRDGTIAHVVVLTVATVLSVFKPWGSTPWTRR